MMAFHVSCQFTCRKICYCTLGTPPALRTQHGQQIFLQNALALQNLLADSRLMLNGGVDNVEVLVPRLPKQQLEKVPEEPVGEVAGDSGEDGVSKRTASRKKVTVSTIAGTECAPKVDNAKKLGDAGKYVAARQHAARDALANGWADRERAGLLIQGEEVHNAGEQSSVPQVVCELCACGEAVGSVKAERMLSCQACKKQYHRKCTKHWAEHRDLFNWGSWVCASCRSCEVCKHTGEPNKLMFCKRCDQAHHAYCLQPPLKHVPKGPFICPKHTCCYSCNTSIPGGGVSSRWFLSYSMCDACGRLFSRGKYCPICLKVYRDSEAAPMVCCDICEHWVHCECDGISDEKYQQFQVDGDLRYKCAACRGDCYKVTVLDEAAIELWKRKDAADAAQIADFRAAAGLPSEEGLRKGYPSSDDEPETAAISLEGSSKKSSKKKIKKFIGNLESATKKPKSAKKAATKEDPKSKSTPIKLADGAPSKPKIILRETKTEKTGISKKSKKGEVASGGALERRSQGRDSKSKSDTDKGTDDLKPPASPLVAEVAVDLTKKEKKKKGEGSKDKGAVIQKRKSTGAEPAANHNRNLKDGSGKIKRLKFSNRQELIDRQEQTALPTDTVERKVYQRGGSKASGNGSVKLVGVSKAAKTDNVVEFLASTNVMRENEAMRAGGVSRIGGSSFTSINVEVDGLVECQELLIVASAEEAVKPAVHEESGATEETDSALQTQPTRGTSPLHWVGHSDSIRRRRVPSSKYRDMDTSAWRHQRIARDALLTRSDEPGPTIIESENLPQAPEVTTKDQGTAFLPTSTDSRKERRRKPEEVDDNMDNDESLDAPRKRLKVADLGGKESEGRPSRSNAATGSPSTKGPIRLKIRKQPSRETLVTTPIRDSKKTEEVDVLPVKGQPSKRKRSATVQKGGEESTQRQLAGRDPGADDSWILQRLGADAISKRVEVFWPIDKIWYKGTVVAVFPQKLLFAVHYDDGEEETLSFGKEKVRLLSGSKKS